MCPKCGKSLLHFDAGGKIINDAYRAYKFGKCNNCKSKLLAEYEITRLHEYVASEEEILHFIKYGKSKQERNEENG